MKHHEHRCAFFLFAACLLLAGLLLLTVSASAGYMELDVATEGKGATVYTSDSGSGKAGILYNGFRTTNLELEDVNGRYECYLTSDYSVWVNVDKAMSLWPEYDEAGYDEWEKTRPCGVFLGEITKDNTAVYTTPKNKHERVRHVKGTLVIVCGEFGSDYYVDGPAEGFISKDAVSKVKDLTPEQGRTGENIVDDAWKATLYASEAEPVYPAASASGYSEENVYSNYTANKEITVLKELGDWVQLEDGEFIEKRFLDPDAPHSYPTAWVKCDGKLDRLNLRREPDTDSSSVVKLCSGVPVHVISQTKEWAVVFITGPNGGVMEQGCVMKKYLSDDGKNIKYDGRTKVRLKQDDGLIPAGTELTVIGVYASYSSNSENEDRFLCEKEDGQYINIRDGGELEPVEKETGINATVRSAVRMRTAPNPDAEVLHQVKAKAKVEVLLRGEIWSIVKYKDEIGYMMSRYLSFP